MNSMTGFGRAEIDSPIGRLGIELTGVNSRFLELSVRLPRSLSALEPKVREYLSGRLSRGKMSLYANLVEPEDAAAANIINRAAVKAYHKQLVKLQKDLGLKGEIKVEDLLLLPDIVRVDKPELDLKVAWTALRKVIDKALKDLLLMRAKEGRALAADMKKRLTRMSQVVKEIQNATKGSVKIYRDKLTARINELMNGATFDADRMEAEVAYFAERTDITEECIRFKSHIVQFLDTLKSPEPAGRRLNFILQELNREVNTIGSKGADFGISSAVITLKEEIEKIREQVQNVE